MDTRICTEQDQFVLDKFEWYGRWVATLEDGGEVYQDDDRYSVDGKRDSSWLRLANYCKENNTFLKNVKLQFRQNEMNFPDRGSYFLTLGAGGEIYSGVTHNFIILGCPLFNDPNYLSEIWVKTPEMAITRTNNILVEDILNGDMSNALIRKN